MRCFEHDTDQHVMGLELWYDCEYTVANINDLVGKCYDGKHTLRTVTNYPPSRTRLGLCFSVV